jgi:hypothetical protein
MPQNKVQRSGEPGGGEAAGLARRDPNWVIIDSYRLIKKATIKLPYRLYENLNLLGGHMQLHRILIRKRVFVPREGKEEH